MFFTVDCSEARARLRSAGYTFKSGAEVGHERWINRQGFEITLLLEPFDQYGEQAIVEAEALADEPA